jgi:hypothetical protein
LRGVIIPDGHNEHTSGDSLAHDCKTSLLLVYIPVAEDGLLSSTEVIIDGVTSEPGNFGAWAGIGLSTLDVEPLDVDKGAAGSARVSDELGDNGEDLGGVNGLARSIEFGLPIR